MMRLFYFALLVSRDDAGAIALFILLFLFLALLLAWIINSRT
jgi:hypothetical protein